MDRSEEASSAGMEEGALNNASSHQRVSAPPPISRIMVADPKDPSPLTVPTTASNVVHFQEIVSLRRVEYGVTDSRIALSVPITSKIPYSNNTNNQTYQEGYDSDGETGPFLDVVAL